MPILGADFLQEYGLLVNLRQGRLLDSTTSLQSKGIIYHIASPSPSLTQLHNTEYHAIQAEFPCDQAMYFAPLSPPHSHTPYPDYWPTSPRSSSQAAA